MQGMPSCMLQALHTWPRDQPSLLREPLHQPRRWCSDPADAVLYAASWCSDPAGAVLHAASWPTRQGPGAVLLLRERRQRSLQYLQHRRARLGGCALAGLSQGNHSPGKVDNKCVQHAAHSSSILLGGVHHSSALPGQCPHCLPAASSSWHTRRSSTSAIWQPW